MQTYVHDECETPEEEARYICRDEPESYDAVLVWLEDDPLYEIEFDIKVVDGEVVVEACRPTGGNPAWELTA